MSLIFELDYRPCSFVTQVVVLREIIDRPAVLRRTISRGTLTIYSLYDGASAEESFLPSPSHGPGRGEEGGRGIEDCGVRCWSLTVGLVWSDGQTQRAKELQFCDSIFLTFSIRFYKSFSRLAGPVVVDGWRSELKLRVTYGLSGFGLHLIQLPSTSPPPVVVVSLPIIWTI